MSLRAASLDDLDDIIALYVKGWQHSYSGLIDADFLAQLPNNVRSRDYLHSLLAGGRDDAVVLLHDDGRVVAGFIAAGRSRDVVEPDLAEIYAVYVDPAQQGAAIGHTLFSACCARLIEKGFSRLHIWTFAANTRARLAYTRWGGMPTGTRTVTVGGDYLEEVGFIWDLV